MADYSKFSKLIEEEEAKEKEEKEAERLRLRLKYEKQQSEKQKKWDDKLIKEGKDPVQERKKHGGCAFQHMQQFAKFAEMDQNKNTENHNHSHDHSHDDTSTAPITSSCGYMPVEQIKKLEEQRKQIETVMTLEQKNKKKITAVYATKTDGNRLFKEKNYELAYKVYERGALIINGMYQLTESEEDEMEKIECLLDLNMALVSLKMEKWTHAIECCQMAIQIDGKNPKAYYRWSEALIGMSEYDKAIIQSNKAKELQPNNIAIDRQLKKINELKRKQEEKAKIEREKFGKRIREKINKIKKENEQQT